MIRNLPRHDYTEFRLHYSLTNWLPFYWLDFRQTIQYTYIIKDLSNLDDVFANFKDGTRSEIKKAEKNLTVYASDDIDEFYRLNTLTFKRQGNKNPYSLQKIQSIDNACRANSCRKIYFAKDENGEVHGAIYVIWDQESAYYLMNGNNPEFRNTGANSLLLWNAIKDAATTIKQFDFEGSMIEPIESYFRSFGAIQTPYSSLTKTNSKLFGLAKMILGK